MDELCIEECNIILQRSIKENNFTITSYNVLPFSNKVEGFLGSHFLLEIKYICKEELKTQYVFLKTLKGISEIARLTAASVDSFGKEDFMYSELFKRFEEMNIDISFAPKSYYSKPQLIVLEDMLLKQFRSYSKPDGFDYYHCKTALKTLAKFHSSSIMYQFVKSKVLGKTYRLTDDYSKQLHEYMLTNQKTITSEWIKYSLEGIFKLISIMLESNRELMNFAKELNYFVTTIESIVNGFNKSLCTVLHGDLWSNNLLFTYKHKIPVDCVIIDYQAIRYGPPSLDVMYFLFNNTRRKFRTKYYDELIDYYYKCFQSNLINHGFNEVIEKSECIDFKKEYQILAKILSICARCITLTDGHTIESIRNSDEDFRRFFLNDRCLYILDNFSKNVVFKEIIEEDILDLGNMLFI